MCISLSLYNYCVSLKERKCAAANILFWLSRRQQSQKSTGTADGQNVIDAGCGCSQQEETGKDDDGQEQSIVVENGKGRCLVVGHFVFLPQRTFVLLFAAHFLVVRQQFGHFTGDGLLALDGNLMLNLELCVAIGHGHQVCAERCDEHEEDQSGQNVQHVNAPENPCGNRTKVNILI